MMKVYMYMIMLIFPILLMNKIYLNLFMYLMMMMYLFIMMLNFNYNSNYMNNIYYWMGLDNLSFCLMILSIFIISMMYLVSLKINNSKIFSLLLLILLISLLFSFSSMNYFLFYLFFEISLLPTFILIMMYGYQPERLNASMYMMLYTLFASLPLLLLIFMMFYIMNSLNYFFIYMVNLDNSIIMLIFYIFMIFAFLVKLPMFLFHMWLPKAHVEAPVSGSMILAGVMLKLGGYGLIRSMNMMLKISVKYNIIIIIINLIGIMILSMLCLRQNDLKVLVAYSSVVHMSMMLTSMMTMYFFGKFSSLMMMIGHGFCSPAMFMLVNFIYERTKSRNLFINKGLINIYPSMMFWWFFFCVGNMGAPITLNLISELFISMSLLSWSIKLIIIMIIMMLLSASYSLYLFSSVFHGKMNNNSMKLFNNKIIEFKSLFMLLIPLNLYILKMDLFI